MTNESIPSLIKWTGSKRSQAHRICALFPDNFNHYYEPFIGGGALLYLMAPMYSCVIADIYSPLIEFWRLVKSNPDQLANHYREEWLKLQSDKPSYFYTVRERFNQTRKPEDLNFLLRTCVNGIVRFNQKGFFNSSFHLSRNGMNPDFFLKNVHIWSNRIQNVEIRCGDYEQTLSDVKSGDLIYFDPPYGGSRQRYIQDLDQDRFFDALDRLNIKGAYWVLSFDGIRGEKSYSYDLPKPLYKHEFLIKSGKSPMSKVLNNRLEDVYEKVFTNY